MSQPDEAIASDKPVPPAEPDASSNRTDPQQALEPGAELAQEVAPQHRHERHELPRKIVNWDAMIAIDTASGETRVPILIRDISAEDFSVECEFNLSSKKPARVTLVLPPKNPHGPSETIQLTVNMPSSVLSHDAFCFRMPFVKFQGQGRESLSRFLPGGSDSMF